MLKHPNLSHEKCLQDSHSSGTDSCQRLMWSMLVMPGQRSQAPEHFQEIQTSVERDPAGTVLGTFPGDSLMFHQGANGLRIADDLEMLGM